MSAPSPSAKKQKLSSVQEKKPPPPPYASQNYWETRYQKHRRLTQGTGSNEIGTNSDGPDSEADALPYHAWYFAFDELRPLIMPLILGGRKEVMDIIVEGEVQRAHHCQVADGPEAAESHDESGSQEREGLAEAGPISVLEVGCGDVPLGRGLAKELEMLAKTTGAKASNIVERIVCCDYSPTVITMMREEHEKEVLASKKANKLTESGDSRNDEMDGLTKMSSEPRVEYVVADARELPYTGESFPLVLEKGTLDAMLSDKDSGAANSQRIVEECARVLTIGGCLILISHLNAHTSNGLDWLESVVIAGLRAGGGNASWEIEVHGSDGREHSDDEDGEVEEDGNREESTECLNVGVDGSEMRGKCADECDTHLGLGEDGSEQEQPMPPSGSPGPAVYIIHKLPLRSTTDGDATPVPLVFHAYS